MKDYRRALSDYPKLLEAYAALDSLDASERSAAHECIANALIELSAAKAIIPALIENFQHHPEQAAEHSLKALQHHEYVLNELFEID